MTWIGSLPYFKILPFAIYVTIYFGMTGADKDYPDESYRSVFFKLLPITSLVFMVLSCASQSPEHASRKNRILLGLLFSMAGDACLVWRVKMFIPGLLFFAVAQILYAFAFEFSPFGGMVPFSVCVAACSSIYAYLYAGVEEPVMKVLVLVYAALIFCMGWRALVRVLREPSPGNICGLVGALLFVASDFLIAVDKFMFPVEFASFRIMMTYYAAQLGISLSVCYTPITVFHKKNA